MAHPRTKRCSEIASDELRRHLVCNKRLLGRTYRDQLHGTRTIVFALLSDKKYVVAYLDLKDDHYSAWSLRTARITSQIPNVRR